MNILSQLKLNYDKLSKTQKRIADYSIKNADNVCFMTLRQFSEEIGVSEITVMNFCKNIGLENFVKFKQEFAIYLRRFANPGDLITHSASKLNFDDKSLQEIINSERECLKMTYEHINKDSLYQFVYELAHAKRIFLAGHEVSSVITRMLALRLQQMGVYAIELNINSRRSMAHNIVTSQDGDLYVVVLFPKYASNAIALIEYLNSNNMKYVSITDSVTSPAALNAQATLLCSNEMIVLSNFVTSAISVANVIASALLLYEKDKLSQNVREIYNATSFLQESAYKNDLLSKDSSQPIDMNVKI